MLHRITRFVPVLLLVFAVANANAADENAKAESKKPEKAAKKDAQDDKKPRGRESTQLKAGDMAPDFELKTLDGKQTVKLSSFRGKKPVALIFGSYT